MKTKRAVHSYNTSSFVLRLWNEPSTRSDQPLILRGSLHHVQSGVKRYFQGLDQLLKLLESKLEKNC